MLDENFVARMTYELQQNQGKGDWNQWRPSPTELIKELNHHLIKLAFAFFSGDEKLISEYAADLGNLAMKAHTLYGQ